MFGSIMPAPLAMPASVTVAPADAGRAARRASARVSVVMIARAASGEAVRRERGAPRRAMPRADLRHRQRLPDHAGRGDEHLARRAADRARRARRHRLGVAQAARAHRDVRAAAVRDDAARAAAARPRPARQRDRRADHRRAREDAGDGRRRVAHDQREIGRAARLDAAGDAGGAEAGDDERGARGAGTPTSRRSTSCTSSRSRTGRGRCGRPARGGRPGRAPGGGRAAAVRRTGAPPGGAPGGGAPSGGRAAGGGRSAAGAGRGGASAGRGSGSTNLKIASVACWSMRALHLLEELEALALVLDLRIALRVAAQVDALAQPVHRVQVVLPLAVEDLQQDVALEVAEVRDSRSRRACSASASQRARFSSRKRDQPLEQRAAERVRSRAGAPSTEAAPRRRSACRTAPRPPRRARPAARASGRPSRASARRAAPPARPRSSRAPRRAGPRAPSSSRRRP